MSNPKYLYYNACIFGAGKPIYKPLIFNDIRSQPIINEAEKYKVSIISGTIPTAYIPIRVMEIEPAPNTDINKTIYQIKMEYKGDEYIRNIMWDPEINTIERPDDVPPFVQLQGEINTKYWLYYALRSFSHFADIINNTLNLLFNDVKTAHPGITSTSPPLFKYENQIYNIYCPLNFINDNIKIYFDLRERWHYYH